MTDAGRLVADIIELSSGDHLVRFEDGGTRTITRAERETALMPTLRFAFANGETREQMRDDVRASDLYRHGDAKLVWVNEGDLWNLMFQGVEVKDMSND